MIKPRRIRLAGHVALMERRVMQTRFWWESKKARRLGRPRRKWEDNNRIYLREIACGMDWINLTEEMEQWRALLRAVMNLRVPPNVGKFLNSSAAAGFSRRYHPYPWN
jgi:hypothetical protein